EVVDGRPFAGRAGRTLFRWLARAGLDERTAREQLLFAAVTRCFPGPSPSGRGDRVPSPAEQAECRSWLDAELRLVRPPLIVLVGRLAIVTMLGPQPLRDVVGQAHVITHVGGESLAIPLPHPSGASSWIHQAGHAELVEAALARLAEELRRLGIVAGMGTGVGARVA
ncbi:MAG: uracil-DNA glycosylase family protein, partial [Gemmatimonadaceae bacterium]